jgi:hypothetical protein
MAALVRPEMICDSYLLSALVSGLGWKGVGVDSLHAEAAHDSQCDGEKGTSWRDTASEPAQVSK